VERIAAPRNGTSRQLLSNGAKIVPLVIKRQLIDIKTIYPQSILEMDILSTSLYIFVHKLDEDK
jgi:hypothetical protein